MSRPRAAEKSEVQYDSWNFWAPSPVAVDAMSGASTGMPPQQKMSSLFDKIDGSGSGSITQQQFDQAFQTMDPPAVFQQQGASAIFAALDPNGTGSVSKQDFVSGMSQLMASLRAEGGPSSAPGVSRSKPRLEHSVAEFDPVFGAQRCATGGSVQRDRLTLVGRLRFRLDSILVDIHVAHTQGAEPRRPAAALEHRGGRQGASNKTVAADNAHGGQS